MKTPLKILPFLITLLLSLPTSSPAGQFKVMRVYDGDTMKAEGSDIEIKVRLVGIDAPETSKKKRETGQPYSQQAKKYLTDLILKKTIDIRGYGLDRYNRILGLIYLNGRNINLEMIKTGLAEVYRGKSPRDLDLALFAQAEQEAKRAKKGMWVQGDKYLSPKEWRKMRKGYKR